VFYLNQFVIASNYAAILHKSPVEACMQEREDRGLFTVTRSAAKQKMQSLSRYKPGFLTLKHGERTMRQAWRLLYQWLPDQHVPTGCTCLPGPTSAFQMQKKGNINSRENSSSVPESITTGPHEWPSPKLGCP